MSSNSFDPRKNYYAVLGLMADAEDIVIAAAYRTLVGKYHPDRWTGDPNVAHARTAEINEAYGILSDRAKRVEYDKARRNFSYLDDGAGADSDSIDDIKELEDRWGIAVSIYPDLHQIRARLSRIAHRLAFSFVITILETKNFRERVRLAEVMERSFLEAHFGRNEDVIYFAKILIEHGLRDALKELNRMVDVFGGGIDSLRVIESLREKYNVVEIVHGAEVANRRKREAAEIARLKLAVRSSRDRSDAILLAGNLGYRYISGRAGLFSKSNFKIIEAATGKIVFEGGSSDGAVDWIVNNLT